MSDLSNLMMMDVISDSMPTKPPGRQTKTGRLNALGWRLLPVPLFVAAHECWHDSKTDEGNAPSISFMLGKEWLVIPPDDVGPAFKVKGKVSAIRVAWRMALEASPGTTYGPPVSPLRAALNALTDNRSVVPASDQLNPKMRRSEWLDRARHEHQAFKTAITILDLYAKELAEIAVDHGDGLREFTGRIAEMEGRYAQGLAVIRAAQQRIWECLP